MTALIVALGGTGYAATTLVRPGHGAASATGAAGTPGPRGPRGPRGFRGPRGPAGPSAIRIDRSVAETENGAPETALTYHGIVLKYGCLGGAPNRPELIVENDASAQIRADWGYNSVSDTIVTPGAGGGSLNPRASTQFLPQTGDTDRVEGQVIISAKGFVLSIAFHAFSGGNPCELFGTAVPATAP